MVRESGGCLEESGVPGGELGRGGARSGPDRVWFRELTARGRRIFGVRSRPRRFTGPPSPPPSRDFSDISGKPGISRFRQISEISDHGA